jgi:hypothetical protein
MLQKQANKEFGTNQEANARQVETSKSHSRRDDHGNDMHSTSSSRHHHSLNHSTKRTHANSGPRSITSMSPARIQGEILRETSCKVNS